jgi:glycine/D-amino acid oxidase-like deaminating enzyme
LELGNLWLSTPPAQHGSPAVGAQQADFVVIGGGIMGASATLALAEAGASVILLEASTIGNGASSKAGGFVVPSSSVGGAEEIIRRLGRAGEALCTLIGGSASRVFDLIKIHGIHCDALQGGWYHPAHDRFSASRLSDFAAQWAALGFGGAWLDAEETAARTGTVGYCASWFAPSGGTLHPLNYCRGLVDAAILAGALCHEHSPVSDIQGRDGRLIVSTLAGATIQARRVLVCVNGAPLVSEELTSSALDRSVFPVKVWQCATDPMPPTAREHLFNNGACLSDMRRNLFTYRMDPAGRLITGTLAGTGRSASAHAAAMADKLRQMLKLERAPKIRYLWEGSMSLSASRFPATLFRREGVIAATSCNGRGIALSTVVGEHLADIALDRVSTDLPRPGRSRMPLALQARAAGIYPYAASLLDRLDALR